MGQQTDTTALEFAGFWRRFAAFFIDAFISAVVIGALISIFFPFTWIPFTGEAHWVPFYRGTLQNSIANVFGILYIVIFWSWRGQTPGMILLNIKVIRTDCSSIGPGYSVLRYLGYVASAAVLGLGFLWIAFDPRKQGWHDKIADTYVIKLPQPQKYERVPAAKPSAG